MDISKLKRRPDAVKAKLKLQKDNSVIVTAPATVLVPKHGKKRAW